MIEVLQHQIRILPYKGTPEEAEIATLAVQQYGFLLKDHPFGTLTQYSFLELASKIEQQYDTTDPRHAEIVRVLHVLHQRNTALH